jgi:hypothetical protein
MQPLSRRERRYAPALRALAALVSCGAAWLLVLAQLTTALHFALISHEVCAAHGELVHRSSVTRRLPARAHEQGSSVTTGAADAEHDHCPLLSRRLERTAALDVPGVRLPDVPCTRVSGVVHADGRVPTRGERLLSAPKQSPPV